MNNSEKQPKAVGATVKGSSTKQAILNKARDIIIEKGYQELSFNHLAAELNIRKSNIQYYYPTKDILIDALIEESRDYTDRDLLTDAEDDTVSPKQKFYKFVDDSLRSLFDLSDRNFFRNISFLATYDENMAGHVKALYKGYVDDLAIIIRQLNPVLSKQECHYRSTLIVSLYEGLGLVVDFDLALPRSKALISSAHDSALLIAMAP